MMIIITDVSSLYLKSVASNSSSQQIAVQIPSNKKSVELVFHACLIWLIWQFLTDQHLHPDVGRPA